MINQCFESFAFTQPKKIQLIKKNQQLQKAKILLLVTTVKNMIMWNLSGKD